jgi:putative RecB family exonuclease
MTAEVLDGTEVRAPASLSPSRAADFLTCPLLYRFRVIDRLPERPSPAATRGTVVHSVLERLFDLPAVERTPQQAHDLVVPEWERLLEAEPELAELFPLDPVADEDPAAADAGAGRLARDAWLQSARDLLDAYFELEDPTRLEPAERELYVECDLESGLRLRGYVDRLDVAPGGEVRVVDYKTGRAPREGFEAKAMFQMRFYALVLWRLRGEVPRLLQLLYLGSGEVLRYEPDEADLRATERKVEAIWAAIQRATEKGDWRPNPTRLCDWCDHQSLCPAFGGTPPELPELPLLPVPRVPTAQHPGLPTGVLADDERPSPHTPGDEI